MGKWDWGRECGRAPERRTIWLQQVSDGAHLVFTTLRLERHCCVADVNDAEPENLDQVAQFGALAGTAANLDGSSGEWRAMAA